jgi:hypothetical protein
MEIFGGQNRLMPCQHWYRIRSERSLYLVKGAGRRKLLEIDHEVIVMRLPATPALLLAT